MADEGSLAASSHSGWLVKKGGNRHNWKRRWFSLEAGKVKYWAKQVDIDSPELPEPLGFFFVKNCECSSVENKKRPFLFQVIAQDRTWFLQASSKADVAEWKLRLERCGALWTDENKLENIRSNSSDDYDSE